MHDEDDDELDAGDELGQAYAAAAERAGERVEKPHAKNTTKAYAQVWEQWEAHCEVLELQPRPVVPRQLVNYLELRSRELAPNSVRLHLAAISALDFRARAQEPNALPVTKHPDVAAWFTSWSRQHPRRPQKQAPSITVEQLEQVLRAAQNAGRRYTARGAHLAHFTRDRCFIVFGVTGGFRVSELCALDVSDVAVKPGGLDVLIRSSKQDQQGKGANTGLMPQGVKLRCPVDAWLAWLKIRGEAPGPAFQAIDRAGVLSGRRLTERAAFDLVRGRARAIPGLELVSTHSMRATLATLAHEKGKDPIAIANQGRWRSLETVRGYMRQVDLFRGNASAGLLD